jgi:hypothetical protein
MLNPSTADDKIDDPTIKRCRHFADKWKMNLIVCNLFAYRATDPRALRKVKDPVGPENDWHILNEAKQASKIVAAWGCNGKFMGRDADVRSFLKKFNLLAFKVNNDGSPKHPLYAAKSTILFKF